MRTEMKMRICRSVFLNICVDEIRGESGMQTD